MLESKDKNRKQMQGDMKKIKALVIGVILTIFTFLPYIAQADKYPFDFFKEKVTLSIDKGELNVEGIYYIRNKFSEEEELVILYPFPIDRYHSYPHQISINYIDGKNRESVQFIQEEEGVLWPLKIAAGATKCILIEYNQAFKDKEATYITTTTQGWGKALEEAKFIVSVPADFREVKLSYQPDKTEAKNNRVFYYINKVDFLPVEDLVVKWK
ncbi:MAG: hypothetical protein DRP74_00085 [Candidatus Omnitrophota bacterium]|nr:MAG: hypothetical protein DRP74_00085 [Candidatus Omnitrophota bacterium]